MLDGAMADATRAADVDEALRIKNSLESLKAGANEGTEAHRSIDELAQRLLGTRWRVGSVMLTFGKGVFTFSDWGGKRGTWQVVSYQTIACVDKDGKRYEFTFDPELNVMTEVANGVYIGPVIRDRP